MKHGRPGSCCPRSPGRDDEQAVAEAMLRRDEHARRADRPLRPDRARARELAPSRSAASRCAIKVGRLDGRVVNLAPEHADCERAARISGEPVKAVWARALAAAHEVRA